MTYLFIGIGNAGGAISDALLEYRGVRRLKPTVLKTNPERDKEDKIEVTLKEIKGIDFAFLFSGLSNGNITPRITEILAGQNIKIILVGILPASRREKREKLINY